jgi:hypothetical protein
MRKPIAPTGFSAPATRALGDERRNVAYAELIATAGLMLGIVVAAIVVSAGIANADVGAGAIDNDGTVFAMALLLGLLFIACGGWAVLPRRRGDRH